jgi:hypothetical protein
VWLNKITKRPVRGDKGPYKDCRANDDDDGDTTRLGTKRLGLLSLFSLRTFYASRFTGK